jgi:hypothetical protein
MEQLRLALEILDSTKLPGNVVRLPISGNSGSKISEAGMRLAVSGLRVHTGCMWNARLWSSHPNGCAAEPLGEPYGS